jgi:hypothetical protein
MLTLPSNNETAGEFSIRYIHVTVTKQQTPLYADMKGT